MRDWIIRKLLYLAWWLDRETKFVYQAGRFKFERNWKTADFSNGFQVAGNAMSADGLYRVTTSYLCAGFVVKGMTLRWLQANLPWTIPYSDMFVASAYSMDRVAHDVMHVMKSLGRIAAECEGHDHGRDRKLYGEAFAKEVADLVICALHIAKLEGFDLQDAVIDNSSLRNKVDIQALAALAHEQAGGAVGQEDAYDGARRVIDFLERHGAKIPSLNSRAFTDLAVMLLEFRHGKATPPAPGFTGRLINAVTGVSSMEQADKSVVPEVSLSRQLDMADAATSVKNPAATPVDAAAYARGLEDAAKVCDRRAKKWHQGLSASAELAENEASACANAIRSKIKPATGGKP